MGIYLALLIPIATTIFLLIRYQKRVVWWEILCLFAASFILIIASKAAVEKISVQDTEYWGGWVTQAEYYEPWDERVSCQHPIYVTDSKGNRTLVGYSHPYDVDDHGPEWIVRGSNGESINVDQSSFDRLVKKFGNKSFVELNRDYHSIDGDEYVAKWPGSDTSVEPLVTKHLYDNRVQAADSVYKFQKIDPKVAKRNGLYEYPEIEGYYYAPTILGDAGPTKATGQALFDRINAQLGRSKQVRVFVLIYRNKPPKVSYEQEQYWKGGNKNELNITIGLDKDNNVQWARVFSWSESETIKVETREYIMSQKRLDLVALAEWLRPEIQAKFVRKQFAEFDYLTVEPPLWAVIMAWILIIGANVGVAYWVVDNEFVDGTGQRSTSRYQQRYLSRRWD